MTSAVPRTALVVDDATAARRRTANLLALAGWEVHGASTAAAARRSAADLRPDLVVTEVVLPDGDGLALLRRLREDGCGARFLVVTGRPTPRLHALARLVDAPVCLAKPVDPAQLVAALRDHAAGAGLPPHPVLRVTAVRADIPAWTAPDRVGRVRGAYAHPAASGPFTSGLWTDAGTQV